MLYDTSKEVYYDDATKIVPEDVPDIDLIVVGFPCQSFSIAGKRRGFEDARGTMFFEIARIAAVKRPRYLLLENVPGLLSHDESRTFAAILTALDDLGYDVAWQCLNSANFGVAQARKRVFIIGFLRAMCSGRILSFTDANPKTLIQRIPGKEGCRVYSPEGLSITLTGTAGGFGGKSGLYEILGLPIKSLTKSGYQIAVPGDSIDLAYADMNSRRGRVGHDIAHTVTPSATQGFYSVKCIDMNPEPQITDLARCITARQDNGIGHHKGEKSAALFMDKPIPVLTPAKEKVRQQGRRFKNPDEPMFTITVTDRNGVMYNGLIRKLMDAIQSLFSSIILVIAATYLLFIAGSIFILKKLKNNKKYYYKTRNFISVSNLIYRMKHNAAGLASICVLSTGVLILLTSAASLQILGNKSIDTLYPNDIKIEIYDDNSLSDEECISEIESIAEKQNESVVNGKVLRYNSALWVKSGNIFTAEESEALIGVNDGADMYLLSLDNYNKYFGADVKLDKDQVLVYSTKNDLSGELNILDKKFSITGEVPEADRDKLDKIINPAMRLYESVVVVFDSDETIKSLTTLDKSSDPRMYICFDTQREWSAKKVAAFTKDVNEYLRSGLDPSKNESYHVEVKFKQEEKAFFYNLYGGAFFVGLFLAVVFLMATALIIYYNNAVNSCPRSSDNGIVDRFSVGNVNSLAAVLYIIIRNSSSCCSHSCFNWCSCSRGCSYRSNARKIKTSLLVLYLSPEVAQEPAVKISYL